MDYLDRVPSCPELDHKVPPYPLPLLMSTYPLRPCPLYVQRIDAPARGGGNARTGVDRLRCEGYISKPYILPCNPSEHICLWVCKREL